MAQKNLQINIRIGLQQVAAAVGSLRQRFNLLRSSFRAVFRTAIVAGFFAALRSGFGVLSGLQNNVAKLIGQFAELNLAATKTAAVASRGGEGFAAAFEQASNMARETSMQVAFSAGQIQEGLFTAAQAGLNLADSMKVTNSAMQLATVGAEDFQSTLNNLIGITRAFGVEVGQIPQFADALTAAMVNSKATLNDLFEGLRNVASVASTAFGESRDTFIDSAAALMTLNDAGIEGSKAGIRLRAAMQKLMGGTAQTTAAFTKYGVNLFQTNAESQKYLGTLLKGQRAFASYSDKLNELKNAQFELIASGKMFTSEYEQVDKQYRDAIGRGSEYIRNNLAQVQALKEKRDALMATGEAYRRGSKGSFQELQEEIDSVGGSLNQLQSGLDDIYNEFTLAGGRLKPFAEILNDIKGKAPTEVIGRAFGIRGGEGIMRVLNNLDKFNRFKQILKEYVQESERGKSITQDIFGKFLDTVLIKWQKMKNSVMAIFGTIADAFFEAIGPVLEPLQMGLEAIFEAVKRNKDVFKQMFQGIADALMPIASQVAVWAAVIADKFRAVFTPGQSVTFPIFNAENGKLNSTEKEFSGGTSAKLGGFVKSLTSLLVEGFRAGLQRLMPAFMDLAKVMADAFAGFMQAKAALWESIGLTIAGALVTGFIQTILKELPKIRSAINDIMEGLGLPKETKIGKGFGSFMLPLRLPEKGNEAAIPKSEQNAKGGMLSFLDKLFAGGVKETPAAAPQATQKKSPGTAFVDFGKGMEEVNLDALESGSKNMTEVFRKVEKSSEIFGNAVMEANRKANAALTTAQNVQRQVFQSNSKSNK